MEKYQEGYHFDFTRTLPLFIYGNKKLSSNIKPQMERAINKTSKLVKLHSITAKPEKLKEKRNLTKEEKKYFDKSEYNKFVDDSYLLMGKAYFWQMEYQTASKVLEYAINEFKNETIEQKNQIWLARCYIELNNQREAKNVLKDIEKADSMSREIRAEFNATYADYYLKQDSTNQAIPYLKRAINNLDEKERKVRYKFILAQLWETEDQPQKAFKLYGKIIEMNPDYRIEFNAKLKRAWLHKAANAQQEETIEQELKKMLKDDKNREYQDRIYYALGQIALQEDNKNQAIKYFKQSAQKSKENVNQKGLSYLKLADIYFEQKKYEDAQAYYDSSVSSLESDYPGYTELYIKTKYLTKLVDNLNTIQYRDSLLQVAQLNRGERNKLINRLIKEHEEKMKKKEEQERIKQRNQALRAQNQRRGGRNRTGSGWYFYSQTAKQRGKAAFDKKWGSRELRDYWRLSNKQTGGFEGFEEEKAEEKSAKEQYSKTNRKYYTQDIPLTDSAKTATHDMIKEAYFNVGMVYMNDLENYQKATESFKKLNEKYPDSSFELPSYYHMYKMYKDQGKTEQADRYKQKIIAEYPESNYAKVVSDPDYFKKLEKKQNVLENKYAKVLNNYKNERYYTVIDSCNSFIKKYDNTKYQARFNYLKALSIGKTQDLVSFREALKHVTKNYPDTEVAEAAKNKLSFLEKTELQQISSYFAKNKEKQEAQKSEEAKKETKEDKEQAKTQETEEEKLYRFREDDNYYFVIIASTDNIDINKMKFDLINFNLDYYLQKDYTTTSNTFNKHNTIITVKRFQDLKATQEYYDILSKKEERVFENIDDKFYEYFYISVKNYPTLLEKKSIIKYLKFFKNNLVDKKTNRKE
jgi:tetratricopeptide (TPR) repeat protein